MPKKLDQPGPMLSMRKTPTDQQLIDFLQKKLNQLEQSSAVRFALQFTADHYGFKAETKHAR